MYDNAVQVGGVNVKVKDNPPFDLLVFGQASDVLKSKPSNLWKRGKGLANVINKKYVKLNELTLEQVVC